MEYSVRLFNSKSVPVRNIYCVGRNYKKHARELGSEVPEQPIFFQKALTSLSTAGEIQIPSTKEIHHELEVVALIGKDGYNISNDQALDHIAGLALGLDLTDRPLQSKLIQNRLPWFLSKSFKNAAVVTDFTEPDIYRWSQTFWLRINGQLVQEGQLADMIFALPALIEYLSQFVPLISGDLIFTGTPEGIGPIHAGDRLELGLGADLLQVFLVTDQ